ncbi:MAG: sigma-70 family RNA polymerase sigma factor [Clostridia bacterium]|jgi:RNA polymerase sporulation-specific sigma factor|nr:sigma-70 family RNA polymerase sigma factor [Clostridia bacterium]
MEEILNEIELIREAKSGNEHAVFDLIEKYKLYVKTISRQYFLTGGEQDDLIQEGMIGLNKAIYSFNLNGNANFKTFAKMCIRRKIQTAVKSANRQKHKPLNDYVFIAFNESEEDEELGLVIPSQNLDPEQQFINKQQHEKIDYILTNTLSKFEKRVLQKYLQGYSYGEIATMLDKGIKSIDNALLRIKKKLLEVQ